MDVADDAEGRVVIFSLDNSPLDEEAPPPPPNAGRNGWMRGTSRFLEALDSRYAAAFVAAVLVGVLVVGLLLTRR
jgi:hypothetical protein